MGAGWEFRIKRETKEVGGEAKRGRCPGWEVNLFFELIPADEEMFLCFRTCNLQMGEGGKGRPRNRLNIKS